jgi:transposase
MTEEEARQLREENAALKTDAARKDQRIEELEALLMRALLRIEELERNQRKDSHNSSKPPSSDGLKHRVSPRQKSGKSSGGQPGHEGHTLMQVAEADAVMVERPTHCEACHYELGAIEGVIQERRQIHELPALRLMVTEHQVHALCCPRCEHLTVAHFPAGVDAPAQYGPQMQALAVYLSQYQLLPMERIGDLLEDLFGCSLSDGTLCTWILEAARTLGPTVQMIKECLLRQKVDHVDETGGRVKGLLHWFHVNATKWLTLYGCFRQRGRQAIDAQGILPTYAGRAIHDRWYSYDHYPCAHSLCGAHLLRDCLWVAEQEKQPWAAAMYEVLLRMREATQRWRAKGATTLPQAERDVLLLQYFAVLQQGFTAHTALSPPSTAPPRKSAGKAKQSHSKNLLDALLKRAEQVLAFLDDLSVPFTNNQAERDLRMIKVQQKVSGTFRSFQGATAFCLIRSYLSTMRKQGHPLLAAMSAVFEGSPFPIAWEPGT